MSLILRILLGFLLDKLYSVKVLLLRRLRYPCDLLLRTVTSQLTVVSLAHTTDTLEVKVI